MRGALWKSWSAIAATVLIAAVLGWGRMVVSRRPTTIAGLSAGANKCEDRPDGGRLVDPGMGTATAGDRAMSEPHPGSPTWCMRRKSRNVSRDFAGSALAVLAV